MKPVGDAGEMSLPQTALPLSKIPFYRAMAWRRYGLPLIFYAALMVVVTWPLVIRMGNSVAGDIGDNLIFVWLIGWFRRALFELHVSPMVVPQLNYPAGWNLAYSEYSPASVLLGLPASLIGGDVFGYNFSLLLSFVLSGFGMFLWVHRLTRNQAASLLSGMLFMLAPYRMAHFLAGHLDLSSTQWLPLYFWGLFEVFEGWRHSPGRLAWKPAILAGIMLGLTGLSNHYYLYMTLVLSLIFGVGYLVVTSFRPLRSRFFWWGMLIFSLTSLPLVILAIVPYLALSQQGGLLDRSLAVVIKYSASPTDFILPSTQHFLWGAWVGSHFDRSGWIENTLYNGLFASLLALVGLFASWHSLPAEDRTSRRVLIILAVLVILASGVLALGPELKWFSQTVSIPVPGFLQGIIHHAHVAFHLPAYFLFTYLPFYAKMRVPTRYDVFVILFTSLMAGLGAAWLLGRVRKSWAPILALILFCLALLDIYPKAFAQLTPVGPRPVDLWLAQQPGQGAVVEFPFDQETDQDKVYYTLWHQKPFLGGIFNAFPPPQFLYIKPVLDQFPSPESLQLVKDLGVQYVIINTSRYVDFDSLKDLLQKAGMEYRFLQGGEAVFEMIGGI